MFITLEGIEGSGKTTQIRHILSFLSQNEYDGWITREPGGTPVGEKIRSIVLDPESKDLVAEAELLLYVADRIQHLNTVIRPKLSEGKVVVCDRYVDATIVYQGYARGLELRLIRRLHQLVCQDFKPDVTLLLDLPVELGLSRAWNQINNGGRNKVETRFEEEKLGFHERVRKGYLSLCEQEPDRFRVIDASKDPEQVRQEILSVLAPLLPKR